MGAGRFVWHIACRSLAMAPPWDGAVCPLPAACLYGGMRCNTNTVLSRGDFSSILREPQRLQSPARRLAESHGRGTKLHHRQ